jgi:hypothetical protein
MTMVVMVPRQIRVTRVEPLGVSEVVMVAILPSCRWGLNKSDPRCDDAEVTVTVGSNRGFEVLHEAAGRSAWTTRIMSMDIVQRHAAEALVGV